LPGYAKIADLDLTRAVNQNVARFYIAMHYSVFVSQVTQALQYLKEKKKKKKQEEERKTEKQQLVIYVYK
jgi:hypothetical protein